VFFANKLTIYRSPNQQERVCTSCWPTHQEDSVPSHQLIQLLGVVFVIVIIIIVVIILCDQIY